MKRRDFLILSAILASSGLTVCHSLFYKKETTMSGKFIPNIQIPLVEHCNLSCKYCCHFSCIADETFYDLGQLKKDLEILSVISNKKVQNIVLTGGEVLLYPYLTEVFDFISKFFPNTNTCISTNALLLNSMKEDFWISASKNNIEIIPSFYPLNIKWEPIINKCQKYKISLFNPAMDKQFRLADLKESIKKIFYNFSLCEKGNKNEKNLQNCMSSYCHTLKNGKIYICPLPAFIEHLNKKFKTNFKVTENDYVDLYQIKMLDDILTNFAKKKIDFCRYCTNSLKEENWAVSQEHTLDEWVDVSDKKI